MKIIRKLSLKLILLQILFLYFFAQAADRLYYTWNYEIMECLYRSGSELGEQCFEKYPEYKITDLIVQPFYFMLYGLLIALIISGILNWKKKAHFLNTVLVFVLYIALLLSGVFKFTKDLGLLLNSFGDLFSDNFWAMNLMPLQIYLLAAIIVIWLSVKGKTKIE